MLKDFPDVNPEPLGKDAELPHISWRFWFATTQGMQADVMAASRRTLTDAEAANALCLDRPCLEVDALHTLLDQSGTSDWTPEKLPAKPAYQAPAVRAVEELFHGALSGGDPLPAMFEDDPEDAPSRLLLERNVSAQDDYLTGVLQERNLRDDSISELWTWRMETPGFDGTPQISWQQRPLPKKAE